MKLDIDQKKRPRRRKPGTTVTFGHSNWEQVVQMMLGIRLAVGAADATAKLQAGSAGSGSDHSDTDELSREAYLQNWKTQVPKSSGGKATYTPFKDYAPQVFRRVRALFGVSDREYMLSLGPEQILGELMLGTLGMMALGREPRGSSRERSP